MEGFSYDILICMNVSEPQNPEILLDPTVLQKPANIFILHDALGGPTLDWIPSVKQTLETMGHTVITPALPGGPLTSYVLWEKTLEKQIQAMPAGTIYIGHGIGGTILLSLLGQYIIHSPLLIMVGSPIQKPTHIGYQTLTKSFFEKPFAFEIIKHNIEHVVGVYSNNDLFVSITDADILREHVNASIITLADYGHMTHADNIDEFPTIVQIVDTYDKQIIKEQVELAEREKLVRDKALLAKNVPGLHTMQTDIARISDTEAASVGGGLLRQAIIDQAIEKENSPKKAKNIFFISFTILAIIIGFVGFGKGITTFIPETATIFFKAPDPSLRTPLVVDTNEKEIILKTDTTLTSISQTLQTIVKKYETKNIAVLGIPVVNNNNPASISDYVALGGTVVPDSIRILGGEHVFYGMVMRPNINPFFIISLPSYDIGYATMKEWERNISKNLGIWMLQDEETVKNNVYELVSKKITVANIDVTVLSPRSFITESGTETITEPLLAWTFLDEKHLLIIKDYNNIPEILARFYEKKGRIGNELLSQ